MQKKRALVLTGGGDCPGLNAVIRGIVKRAHYEKDWEIIGSIEAYNGVLNEPQEIIVLDSQTTSGIHVRGGTIIHTTNRGGPFAWPVHTKDGKVELVDRSDELLRRLEFLGVSAVISIGGDGSQKISQALYEKGLQIIGVPKTIDNDLDCTDFTFGFQTAVQIATEAVDKLVTTAASHNRVMILEVMGRDAGWIALHVAIAGGAEIALLPEFPYDINKVIQKIEARITKGKGFAIIVIAEGAKDQQGKVVCKAPTEAGYKNRRLGGVGHRLEYEIRERLNVDVRTTILGHVQRGGGPIAYDRILATMFGVSAFELVLAKKWGHMVAYKHPRVVAVPINKAIRRYNVIRKNDPLVHTANGLGISLGI